MRSLCVFVGLMAVVCQFRFGEFIRLFVGKEGAEIATLAVSAMTAAAFVYYCKLGHRARRATWQTWAFAGVAVVVFFIEWASMLFGIGIFGDYTHLRFVNYIRLGLDRYYIQLGVVGHSVLASVLDAALLCSFFAFAVGVSAPSRERRRHTSNGRG